MFTDCRRKKRGWYTAVNMVPFHFFWDIKLKMTLLLEFEQILAVAYIIICNLSIHCTHEDDYTLAEILNKQGKSEMHLKTLCSNLVLVNYAFFSSDCGCTWASICWSKDVFVVLRNWCQRSAVSWHPEAEQWVLLALMDTGNKHGHLTAAFSLAQQPCSLVLRGIIAAHSDDLWPHLQPASELCMRVCVRTVKKNREKMTVCVWKAKIKRYV